MTRWSTRSMALTAMFTAMNVALSSFGIPVPGGHFYLNDIVICLAAILLDPAEAFIVGGVGAFLGDLLFYPAPMFVSLVTHGLQALVISFIVHRLPADAAISRRRAAAIVGVTIGAVIMVAGYTLGRAFIYSTPEYAVVKLPYQILQAAAGAVLGVILAYGAGIEKLYRKYARV